jgi:sRNA-binding protein
MLFGTAVPLAVGIDIAIADALGLDGDGSRDLRRILSKHVDRRAYQAALLAEGAVRYSLDSNPAGEVTAEQRAFAEKRLAKLKRKAGNGK